MSISSSKDKTASVSISLYGKNRFDNLLAAVCTIFNDTSVFGHTETLFSKMFKSMVKKNYKL